MVSAAPIILSSVYLLLVGKSSIRLISKIADIPHRILFPIVFVLCVFGAYAVNNSTFDVMVMMIMGMVGFAMPKLEIPAAPFLIAFILGPMLEDNFRQSLLISKGSMAIFFSSPICWVFWCLTTLVIGMTIWSHIARKQKLLVEA